MGYDNLRSAHKAKRNESLRNAYSEGVGLGRWAGVEKPGRVKRGQPKLGI